MLLIRFLVLLIFFSFSALAADLEAFHIAKFISGRSIPPAPNQVIQSADENSSLELVTEPLNLKAGEILLRRGFGNNEYGLYKGLLAVEAYSRLSVFETPKGTKPSDFVNCKFYEGEVVNPDQDIHSIYFDNDFIYAENTAKLYFNLSETGVEWNTLEMIPEKPWRLSITTEPQGAEVYIDDKLVGKTPLLANALTESIIRLKISIDGYYSIEVMVQKEAGKILEKNFTMNPQVSVTDISKGEQFALDSSQSARDVINIIAKLKVQLQKVKDDGSVQLKQFEQNYPPLPPKDPFEKSIDFAQRELEYKRTKETQRKFIEQSIEQSVDNTKKAIEIAEKYRIELEKRVYTCSFPLNLINLSNPAQDYDADAEAWNTELKVESHPFNFYCKGKIIVPPNIARDIYTSQAKDGYLVLEYNDRSIIIDSLIWYYSLTKIYLVYNGITYPVEGKIRLGEQIVTNPEYNNEISRLQKIANLENETVKNQNEDKSSAVESKTKEREKQSDVKAVSSDSIKTDKKTALYFVPKFGLNFCYGGVGFKAGGSLLAVLGKHFSLEPQLLFARRYGQHSSDSYSYYCDACDAYCGGYYEDYDRTTELDYLEIPLTVNIHFPLNRTISFSFSAAPVFSFCVSGNSNNISEIAVESGAGFNIIGKHVMFCLTLKYFQGMTDAYCDGKKNQALSLTFGMGFRVNKSK
ncbi:MAG: PEGA domain-containing protein [Fibrobacter sp.]|nr:PEGA domain-containing protein [Fibrobacter sp.]